MEEKKRSIEWLVREIIMSNSERSRRDRELIRRGEFEQETRKRVTNLLEQEIEKAREEGRKNIFTKEESRVIRWAFRNMEEQINTVWDEETYNQVEKKLEYYLN